MSLPRRLAIIDVESTGAHPVRDRITEIAILRIEDGEVVARWESLVAPGQAIPPLIEQVTGISDAMVADAPPFEAVADTVAALLDGCVFVAYSARFDFGFIKNAFTRIGREFAAPVLCTVKLSRALFPEHHRHGLDALIERHGLVCAARHRAMGDVEVLWQFVRQVEAAFAPEVLARAAERAMKAPVLPPGLPEGMLEAVPDVPGLYLFHAGAEAPADGRRDPPLVRRPRPEPARAGQGALCAPRAQGSRCRTGGAGKARGVDRDRRRARHLAAGAGFAARLPSAVQPPAGARRRCVRAPPAGQPAASADARERADCRHRSGRLGRPVRRVPQSPRSRQPAARAGDALSAVSAPPRSRGRERSVRRACRPAVRRRVCGK